MEKLKRLRLRRGQLKAAFTRNETFVNDTASLAGASLEMLQARLQKLVSNFKVYEDVNLDILSLDDGDDENISEVEEKYFHVRAKLSESMAGLQKVDQGPSDNNSCNTKLPNIEIPCYDGKDCTKYRPFMDLFTAVIDKNNSLSNIQKLFYLRKYLLDDALSVIINLPLVDKSYPEALSLLKKRFDNKARVITNHINLLLDLPQVQKGTASSIRTFISEAQQQIYALKNLEQPIEKWDMLLISILGRKLDPYTYRAYQLDRENPENLPTIAEFILFLERRAIALEDSPAPKSTYYDGTRGKPIPSKVSNAATKDNSKAIECIYCNQGHGLYMCPKFKTASIAEKLSFVNSNKLCKTCLRAHTNKCKYNFKCNQCKQSHNSLLHEEVTEEQVVTLHSNNHSHKNILLPTVQVKVTDKFGHEITVKALLDSGSQASIIKKSLVDQLQLSPTTQKTNIIGIGKNNNQISQSVNVSLNSHVHKVKFQVKCHVVDSITTNLPQTYFDVDNIQIPSGIQLADVSFNVPSEIPLLLGADLYFKALLDGHISLTNGLVLQNTLFGYIVGGSVVCNNSSNAINGDTNLVSNHVIQCESSLDDIMQQFWLTEKVPEVPNKINCESQEAENIFKSSVTLEDDRFYVDMPLKEPLNEIQIGDSFSAALQRFYALEKKFKSHPDYFAQYKKFINEYISLGHAKVVDIKDYDVYNDPVYFLSHHAVLNEDSISTKLRVVFNGSMKTRNNVSLNDFMLNGPIVQSELFDVLTLFRTYRYTLICDIEKMFRQIYINSHHAPLQNILWRDDPSKPIVCLQLQTVTYGLKASTYLGTRCLIELALLHKDRFPLAADAIIKNTYVDDVICGSDSVDQLQDLKQQLIDLLKLGSFTLHKWCSNNTEILEDIKENQRYFEDIDLNKDNIIKTLGLKYNILTDTLMFTSPTADFAALRTKREILSFIGKMFDPLGLIGPIVVTAKLFMQSLWNLKVGWDTVLPPKELDYWQKFIESLGKMQQINVPRGIVDSSAQKIELLGYCDASFKAIACCLYLRVFHSNGKITVNLLCSKSRVAPLNKSLTIPNLELNSAVLLSQLAHRVYNTLKSRFPLEMILHSDSQIVLAWLCAKYIKKGAYVSNRVKQINELTKDFSWTYVKSADNPADVLSRGTAPHKLQEQKIWWHGPEYLLLHTHESKPPCTIKIDNQVVEEPVDEICNTGHIPANDDIFQRYSNFYKLKRIIAMLLRFKNNCLNANNKLQGFITPKELHKSQTLILRHIQNIHFKKEIESLTLDKPIKSNLSGLHIFLDHDGILRVGGRLHNATNISYAKKHPIILPKSNNLTQLLIKTEHLRLLHAGAKLLLSSLSQRYWLVGGIREVKKVVNKCIRCFQTKAEAATQLMGSLPADRITPSRPFEVTGIDFCGPFDMKIARIRKPLVTKCYIALFVCFSTKAIHVELVSDLTTETFLACLRRFMSRRGMPIRIYCDNAQTFKGADNYLKDLYKLHSSKSHIDAVDHFCCDKMIRFKYIPSYSPEFGGLWEAGVKSVKYHLKRVVGNTCLTFEELYTVITQIEAILNSRPLLPMSSDVSDLSYLTPGHFLVGAPLTGFPELDLTDTNINRLKFWQICIKLKQQFWKVWSSDYLTQLQNRPKWKIASDNLKEGDLVIVKQANVPSLNWPMGRIVKTFPGSDNKVRVAEIRMANNKTYTRSYKKICPLPLD